MNRKKFVKQCMAMGMPRNTAVKFAGQLRSIHAPYAEVGDIAFFPTTGKQFHVTCTVYGFVELYPRTGSTPKSGWEDSELYRWLNKGMIQHIENGYQCT